MNKKNLKERSITSVLLFVILFLVLNNTFFLVLSLLIFGVFSLLEFFSITKKIFKKFIYKLISNFIFSTYVFLFCILFFIFSNFLQLKIILFIIILSCIASDIGGFIFGKIFKGPKLTSISPNKTFSGSIGSFFMTAVVFSSLFFYLRNDFSFILLIISFFISLSSQMGDLFFSLLKRKANIKDTGKIFPGHGGVLDRLDSIYFGIPVGYISFIYFY